MKKIFCLFLICFMILSLSACGTESLTEEQIRAVIQDELSKSKENAENNNNSPFGTPEDDYTKYFNFVLIDDKYCALSVKSDIEIPEVLVVPNKYNDIDVVYTGAQLINALPVKTIIFESGVECSYWLCGEGNNCPTLEKIVFLSENPEDCLKSKLRLHDDMPLQLNNSQLQGKCKIFIPDNKKEEYLKLWGFNSFQYEKLIHPLSQLDDETSKYIK